MIDKEEFPTVIILAIIYSAFVALTFFATTFPLSLVVIALAIVIAMHSSLQHEVLHGHPFKRQWMSEATVFLPIGLFIPYLRFKDLHLAHHFDPNLTDPYDDPESNFLDIIYWQKLLRLGRWCAIFNNTLFGRMLIGPIISLGMLYYSDFRLLWRGDRRVWLSYVLHIAGAVPVLVWLIFFTEIPLWAYGVAAYLGMSLLKIRTFLEHRAHDRAAARSVIIEDKGPLALLFLNNNYHSVHHAHPKIVWHKLPKVFEKNREKYLARNDSYVYQSYRQIFIQYMFRPKDPVAHPFWTFSNKRK